MFGSPAAAAGLAIEAWCLLPDDAAATAEQVLLQPAKQTFLLERGKTHRSALPPALVEPALATQMQPMQVAAAQMQPMQIAAAQMQPMQVAGLSSGSLLLPAAPVNFQMPALQSWYPMPYHPPMMHPAAQPMQMQDPLPGTQPLKAPPANPMQFSCLATQMSYPYPPMMMPLGWSYGPQPQMPGTLPYASAWQPAGNQQWAAMADNSKPLAAQKQKQQTVNSQNRRCYSRAFRHADDSAAEGPDDDDWIAQHAQVGAANTQVAKFVYKAQVCK